MSNHENVSVSQEEIDRTARINMEVCATYVGDFVSSGRNREGEHNRTV